MIFNRYADIDMDGTASSDVFDTAGASVVAQETNGVALTSLGNPGLVESFGAETFSNWGGSRLTCLPDACRRPTAPGDYVAEMQHQSTLAPGATVNFRVGYRLL